MPYGKILVDQVESSTGKVLNTGQVTSELNAIARSLNVADTAVIYSTDTTTVLDDVLYIYDASTQTTWGVPTLDSAGKTIVSVSGSDLTTTGGIGVDSYTLTTINKSGIEFATIADIDNGDSIGGNVSLIIGDSVVARDYATGNNSGLLFFKVVAAGTGTDDGGKYIDLPGHGLQLEQNLRRPYNVKAWGASGDDSDDTDSVLNSLAHAEDSRLYFPTGVYAMTKTINLKHATHMVGENGTHAGIYSSTIKFADNLNGILIHRSNTNADDQGLNKYTQSATTGADGAIIENLQIIRGSGGGVATNNIYHGIRFIARGLVRNCKISGFQGTGIYSNSTSGGSEDSEGNANNWHVENTRIQNCYHGIHVDNADVNAGVGVHIDASSNRGVGIFDSSFLGCQWIGCHTNGNGEDGDAGLDYDILHDNSNARSSFVGCYVETGGKVSLVEPAIRFGGDWAGVTIEGNFLSITEGVSNLETLNAQIYAQGETTGTGDYIELWNKGSHSSSRGSAITFRSGAEDGSNQATGRVVGRGGASSIVSRSAVNIEIFDGTLATPDYESALQVIGETNTMRPGLDNIWSLGEGSLRFTEIYSVNSSINTSDEREKAFEEITELEKIVALEIKNSIKKFKWDESIKREEDGGHNARIHFGVGAQTIMGIFESNGLSPCDYSLFCYDEWGSEIDDSGNLIKESGNRYGIRYTELLMFVMSAI